MIDERNRFEGRKAPAGADEDSHRPAADAAAREMPATDAEETVRAEKVDRVQNSLQAGSYRVPASAVAAKIVSAMLSGHR